jgi:hypothetical protein
VTPAVPARGDRGPLGLPPLALAALCLAAAAAAALLRPDPYGNPDAHAFEAIARSLLAGGGLRYREPMLPWLDLFAFRSPGYPVFLAPLLALGGIPLALAANGALLAWSAAQAGEIASRVAGRRAGWIAFGLVLAWLPAWTAASQLMSESLFVALSATAVRVALGAMSSRSFRAAALAGALAAACTLTRPVGLAVLAGIALGLVLRAPRAAFACLLVAAVAYAPWPLRNLRVLGAPVLFSTNAGFNLLDGADPVGTGAHWREMATWRPLGELAIDARWRDRHRALLAAAPKRQALRSVREFVRYVVPFELGPEQWLHRAVVFVALAGLLLAAFSPEGGMLAVAWLGQGAINALAQVNARYRFPSEWLVAVFAALAVEALRRRYGTRRALGITLALVAMGAAALAAQLLKREG